MKKIILSLLALLLITGCNTTKNEEETRNDTINDTFSEISLGKYEGKIELTGILSKTIPSEIDRLASPNIIYENVEVTDEMRTNIEEVYNNYKGYYLQYYEILDEYKEGEYYISKLLVQTLSDEYISENINHMLKKIESLKGNELKEYMKELDFRYEECFLNGSRQDYVYIYIHQDSPNTISQILFENK